MWSSAEEAKTNFHGSLHMDTLTVGQPARTYLHCPCADTGCNLKDLPGVMDDSERWRKRIREICAVSAI